VSTGAHEHQERNDRAAAERLLAKIRTFVAEQLDDDEAALFAALVAPAVAQAYQADDASGFGSDVDWRPSALPESLAAAVRDGGVRVEGLAEE
jgi:hypothetical protein